MRAATALAVFVIVLLGHGITSRPSSAQEGKQIPEPTAKAREWAAPRRGHLLPSPDGRSFLVFGNAVNLEPNSVTLYDAARGEPRWTQMAALGVSVATFSPNGKWLAERPLRFTLTIRAAETGENVASIEDCGDFAFTPDSRGIVYRDQRTDEIIHWQMESKSVLARRSLPAGQTYGRGILISPAANCVVVSNWDNQKTALMSFDLPELTSIATYQVYSRDDWQLANEGNALVANVRHKVDESSRRLTLITLPELKARAEAKPHATITCFAALPANGRYLLGTSSGLGEAVWDGWKLLVGNSSAWQVESPFTEKLAVGSIVVSKDQRHAIVTTSQYVHGSYSDALRIFDLAAERQIAMLTEEPKSRIRDAAFVDDDRSIAFIRTRGVGKNLVSHAVLLPLQHILSRGKTEAP